jgi:uncharacterized protein (TIGR02145 family)
VTWELDLVKLEIDEDSIIINIDDGVEGYRHEVRGDAYCIDAELTATGFDGIRGSDWENIFIIGSETTFKYGALYNQYAATDAHGLAPVGWHVPSRAEFLTLETYLGGPDNAGEYLKEIGTDHWDSPNIADNSSGFTARGAGWRHAGVFASFRKFALWWSSTEENADNAWSYEVDNSISYGTDYPYSKKEGYSVRCIRDNDTGWVEGEQVTDYDGNVYETIKIGTQIWLKQNLQVTHYIDGTLIPEVTDQTAWLALTTGAMCYYNNDINNALM